MDEMIRIQMAGGEIVAENFEAIAKLHAKIGAASASIARVDKDARNQHHRYEYTSYGALAAAANHAMAKYGLAFGVSIVGLDVRPPAGESSMSLTIADTEASITDIETGATRIYRWAGMGADSLDKGAAKALTNAVKYGLMRSLLVSDQEADPDDDGEVKPTPQRLRQEHDISKGETKAASPPLPPRPWDAETTKRALLAKVRQIADTREASGKFRNFVASRMNDLFDDDPTTKNAKRHSVLLYVFGVDSSSELDMGQCKALGAWSTDKIEEDDQEVLLPNDNAIKEAAAIVKAYEAAKGQKAMAI
jgi:hypothetical protein